MNFKFVEEQLMPSDNAFRIAKNQSKVCLFSGDVDLICRNREITSKSSSLTMPTVNGQGGATLGGTLIKHRKCT